MRTKIMIAAMAVAGTIALAGVALAADPPGRSDRDATQVATTTGAGPTEDRTPDAGPTEDRTPDAGRTDDRTPGAGPTDDRTPDASPTDDRGPAVGPTDDDGTAPATGGGISADEAAVIAVARAGGAVVKVEREWEHGRLVWSVRLTGDRGRTRVDVDAATGQVVEIRVDGGGRG